MLNGIQSYENGAVTLLIEMVVRDEAGMIVERLPETEYSVDAVPEGALTPAEVAWVEKCYPTTTVRVVASATPYVEAAK